MDKLDKSIIDMMRAEPKFDGGLVNALCDRESALALVRVRNPLQLGMLERRFDVRHVYPFIRSVGIRCELKDAILLERMQEVEYVSAQGRVFALSEAESPSVSSALVVPDGLDGRGVTICVMDTGISPHSDLCLPKQRIVHFVDMIGGETQPYDDNGHGTFVAGVACGDGVLSGGNVCGVAPAANIVGVKVISGSGESGTFKILDGMQWLFDNFRQYGIRVVCMSFGAEPLGYADPLKMGAEMLARSGIIVVAAAGNSGKDSVKSPAVSGEVIAVGAVDGEGNVASFSSRGAYQGVQRPDIYASGVNVKGIAAGGTYSNMTGTSASAPYVAGACCLLCQKFRNITPKQAKQALLSSAETKNGVSILKLQGRG